MLSAIDIILVLVALMVVGSIYMVIKMFSVPVHYKSTTPAEIDGPEIIVVGSGVLGSTLAAVLARDGRRVTVIERSLAKPDRFMGELMLAYGVNMLKTLGLSDCIETIGAVPHRGICFVATDSKKKLEIQYDDYQYGRFIINGNFVQSLRRAAQEEKRCKYIEGNVIALIEEDGVIKGIRYKTRDTEDMQELRAPLTVIADGPFSRLRKVNTQEKPTHISTIVALEHKGPFGKDGILHIYMTKGDTVLFYPIAEDCWRILVDIQGAAPKNVKESVRNSICAVPDDLRELYMDAAENSKVRTSHTFIFPTRATFKPGVLTLGDALNIRHPFSGAGMSIALRDIYLWRNYLREIPNLEDIKAMYKAHHWFLISRQIPTLVCNINTANLYELTKTKEDIDCYLRAKYFDFLNSSKTWTKLSADMEVLVDGNPLHLIWFSLGMILYLAKCMVLREPWYLFPKGLFNGGRLVAVMLWDTVSQIWNELKGIEV